jgi:signal transduction histidine kinase
LTYSFEARTTNRFERNKAPFCAMIDRSAAAFRLSEFLSVASHEMKTPLAGIKAYVELLADGDADDDTTRQEFLDGISSQTERLERKIEELLEMARCLGETDER